MAKQKFTIEEIKTYLNGWLFVSFGKGVGDYNCALLNAISQIEDEEDGIEAVLERRKEYGRKANSR